MKKIVIRVIPEEGLNPILYDNQVHAKSNQDYFAMIS